MYGSQKNFFAEYNLRVQAEEKVTSLQEELDMYKDWVRRLQEGSTPERKEDC